MGCALQFAQPFYFFCTIFWVTSYRAKPRLCFLLLSHFVKERTNLIVVSIVSGADKVG